MYQTNSESKASVFYTVLIMVLFLIPNYFAIKATIDKEISLNKQELIQWTNKVEKGIFTKDAEFPRSVKFTYALYDKNHNAMVSHLEEEPKSMYFESFIDYPYMYFQKNIDKNVYGVAYIICSIQINHSIIIMTAVLLFVVILIIIYMLSKIMIKNTITPYRMMQRYMDDFFNDSMHELKTPLGVININLELMSRNMQPSKHVKRIQAAAKQMQMTYEDVEYYIKNKRVKFTKEKINLSEYIKLRIEFFEDIALTKAITLKQEVDDNLIVYMNTTEIQRLIDNTISNAIKYSHFKGEVRVNLKKGNDFCVLSVQDFGQGIKDTKAIFNRFKREDIVQGGFGLGLNIVQNICFKNNIQISIDSIEEEGSTFTYKIQLDRAKFLDKAENENN